MPHISNNLNSLHKLILGREGKSEIGMEFQIPGESPEIHKLL